MLPDMKQILVITAGGTIDKVYFDAKSDFEVGQSVVTELLAEAHVHTGYKVVEVMRKDSLDMTDADRALIRRTIYEELTQTSGASLAPRVIITHGTDTMTDTAGELASLVGELQATIVLTGALSPARFARSDATFNVGMAFATVQCASPGVYIVMNGQVFDGLNVVKNRAQNRFEGTVVGVKQDQPDNTKTVPPVRERRQSRQTEMK